MFLLTQKSPRGCWIVGHRGAMGHAPENTMASFRLGVEMGVDFVECDVHLSKDGKCVVMHDEKLDRTTNGKGWIKDFSSVEIKKLDAGSWFSKKFSGERPPFLDELLGWAKDQKSRLRLPLGVVIEIKNDKVHYPGIAEKTIRVIKKTGMALRVVLISFDHTVIRRSKEIDPDICAGILFAERLKDPVDKAHQKKADTLFPRRVLINKSLVRQAHENGLGIAPWTVNELSDMKKMIRCGVDAIATNFPDRLAKILDES